MHLIHRSLLIHDTAENIFTALTAREDVARWWGLVNPDADGVTTWVGMDRTWAVPIVAMEAGSMLAFALESHHPYDTERTEPTEITFTITEHGNSSIVTVVQSAFSDDAWNELIHDGWGYTLIGLALWVEHGITLAELMDEKRYHTVKKGVPLAQDAAWVWNALTSGTVMSTWLDAEVTSDPLTGGVLRCVRTAKDVQTGEWRGLSEPRNLVAIWWDANRYETAPPLGRFVLQQWLVLPAVEGSVVTLIEYGHDLRRTSESRITRIERTWDARLAALQRLAAEN